MKIKKLYELENNRKIRVIENPTIPVSSPNVNENNILNFYYTDGMYSFCKNQNGDIIHIAAWTEVEDLGGIE